MMIFPIIRYVARSIFRLKEYCYIYCANVIIFLRWRIPKKIKKTAPEVIISLTSYPPRYNHLHKTIQCLLTQSYLPSKVILWVSEFDALSLPSEVLCLKDRGLTLKTCKDYLSYKKIIPALEEYPDSIIVTADDDLYYSRNWLENLYESFDGKSIIFNRGHRISWKSNKIQSYSNWEMNVQSDDGIILPTNGAGSLFPPGSLSDSICNYDLIKKIAPHQDDIYIYCMAKLNSTNFKKAKGKFRIIQWEYEQSTSLAEGNLGRSGNDICIQNIISTYGEGVFK